MLREKTDYVNANYTIAYKKLMKTRILCFMNFIVLLNKLFQMRSLQDNNGTGGTITVLVFDENQQERRFWRIVTLEFQELRCFFPQIFIILFLIAVSLVNIVFFELDCEVSTFWFSLLSLTVRYALPNPKLRIK